MAERQQALADGDPRGPGGGEPVLVHRRRRHQHHAQQRAHPDQSQAARRAQDRAPATIIRRLQPQLAKVAGHHAVHAAGAGPDGRRPRQPHAVPVHARGPEHRRAEHLGAAGWWTSCRRCRSCATWPPTSRPTGWQAYSGDRPRHRLAPRHHAADDRQHALRRLRPAPDLDHVHPVEPVPRDPGGRCRSSSRSGRTSHRQLYVASASGGQVPLGAFAIIETQHRRRCRSTTRASSRRHHLLQSGARRVAGRGGRRPSSGRSRTSSMPLSIQAAFQGAARGLPGLARPTSRC